jgi:hypothetical protein
MIVADDGGGSGSLIATAQVTNVPPSVALPLVSPAASAEGAGGRASATFSDGGANGPHTCSVMLDTVRRVKAAVQVVSSNMVCSSRIPAASIDNLHVKREVRIEARQRRFRSRG